MEYEIKYTKRKSIGIKITPTAEVKVSAPKWMPKTVIKAFVLSKRNWITNKQKTIKQHIAKNPLPVFENGTEHYFLGQKKLLKITSGKRNSVKFINDEIIATTTNHETQHIETLVYKGYAKQAKTIFEEELANSFTLFNGYNIKQPIVKVRRMKTMWGNCRPTTGVVTLNSELIRADIECVRYVIIHELCHLVHFNHSRSFYNLQAKMFPQWKVCKARLKNKFAIRR